MSEPLVSICVISYNSVQTIKETLDSIAEQTYPHNKIEVVISDDASTDGTQRVILDWIKNHEDTFYKIISLDNSVNGGVSRNCNCAWKSASGLWIKTIAADDLLLSGCVQANVDFIASQCNVDIVMSRMIAFSADGINRRILSKDLTDSELRFFSMSADMQHVFLQSRDISGAPSTFMSRSMLSQIGYAEEKYTMMEDHPLWYKCTGYGYKIHFLDVNTVMYRIGNSITRSNSSLVNVEYLRQVILFDKQALARDSKISIPRIRKMIWIRLAYTLGKIYNRKNIATNIVYFIILLIKPGYASYKINSVIKGRL